jgi:hypothetical protein
MRVIYNSEIYKKFIIKDFAIGKPVRIFTTNNLCISVHKVNNIVYLFTDINEKSYQTWVFEKDIFEPEIYYIRSPNEREGHIQYLGNPNKNNIVFLYTSKNRYTRWRVTFSEGFYNIVYAGDKFDIKKHCLVVACYNESIEWLLPYNDIAIIYHKGPHKIPPFDNVIVLPNIGREGHTYLHHIIENYSNLSDRVTFIQADPLLHNDTILFGIDNSEKLLPFQPLGLRWLEKHQIPPNSLIAKHKTITSYGLEYLKLKLNSDLNYAEDYYFNDEGINVLIKNYKHEFSLSSDKSIGENFLRRASFPINYTNKSFNSIDFTFSALFSVIRTNIKIYDIDIYKSLLSELLVSNDQGGVNGYVLERLWCFILDNI